MKLRMAVSMADRYRRKSREYSSAVKSMKRQMIINKVMGVNPSVAYLMSNRVVIMVVKGMRSRRCEWKGRVTNINQISCSQYIDLCFIYFDY